MVGAGVVATSGGLSLSGCARTSAETELLAALRAIAPNATLRMLNVPKDQVISGFGFSDAPYEDYVTFNRSFDLPRGSLLYQNSRTSACMLTPGTESNVLIRLLLLNLITGATTTLLDKALDDAKHYCIYDARLNDSVVTWVECDMTLGEWSVYAARLLGTAMGTPYKLEEGHIDYEPPLLCVYDSTVYWTVMPDPYGPANTEDSFLRAAKITGNGVSDQRTVYTSHGRMITTPQATEGLITIVPRVDTNELRYQLTALSTADDSIVAVSILPAGLRVSDCVYMRGDFTFCIEGNYSSAEGLRFFGTYEQLEDGSVLHINRVPASPALLINNCLIIKSTINIVGFDLYNRHSFIVDKPNDCADYGDLLAGCGVQDNLVVYTTIVDKSNAEKSFIQVRIYNRSEPGQKPPVVEEVPPDDGETPTDGEETPTSTT